LDSFSFNAAFSALKVPTRSLSAWKQLGHTLEEIAPHGRPASPSKMIQIVREAVYDDYARTQFPDYDSRREDLNTLSQFASQYASTDEFLDQMALMTNAEQNAPADGFGEDAVTLSSVHQAKGLEWKNVFLVWLTEGMFPSQRSMGNADALEEERRLFYVALTRAEDDLYLSWPLIRRNLGSEDALQRVSPFLQEIPSALMEEWQVSGGW
jgi:DNA helicase-2/ATP-dependent DNA helicase PcrA